jgi:ABC-type transport system substrate-binding protein
MMTRIKRSCAVLLATLLASLLAACSGTPQTPQVALSEAKPQQQVTAVPVLVDLASSDAPETGVQPDDQWTTPHPILGASNGHKVRQAIAYCTNRSEIVKTVYPFLDETQQQQLIMDTMMPQGHWAQASDNIIKYPFDVQKGRALLEEAGWAVAPDAAPGTIRKNAAGEPLYLQFVSTNAQFRVNWATILEQQLKDNCGIQIGRLHIPSTILYGDTSGLARRDFELGGYAWVGDADPGGQSLYACNQIPSPSNNWEGQNYTGWCNETASKAVVAANNSLLREERKKHYAILQEAFTQDIISLPLFNRAEAFGWNNKLKNFRPNATEYYTANAGQWALAEGDTVVLGFTQEPGSMHPTIENAAVMRTIYTLMVEPFVTRYDYDYQPYGLTELPTIENGQAQNVDVVVNEGDQVWTTSGEPAALEDGVEVVDATGKTVVYTAGRGPITMKQLTVTYTFAPDQRWSDGQPVTKADFELGYRHNCSKDSGSSSYITCDSVANVAFANDTSYTVTYVPGNQRPTYFLTPITSIFPAHRVITTPGPYAGKTLAEVPDKDWVTLREVIETPLSYGPYVLTAWEKGQQMTLEANPYYYRGEPAVKRILIRFTSDTTQAANQLINGEIDVVGSETIGAGAELESVVKAAQEGTIQADVLASATWEHLDMNLFVK